MMGGGTTVTEALKLGCKVIAGDINPVSWFLVKKQVEDIDPEILVRTLQKLDDELGSELRQYYQTTCPECEETAEAIFLAMSPNGSSDFVICPQCWNVFESKSANRLTKCTKCDEKFTPTKVSFSKGRRYTCTDPDCGHSEKIVDVARKSGKFGERMYAIEFYCKHCDDSKNKKLANGRGYRTPDDMDRRLLEEARE